MWGVVVEWPAACFSDGSISLPTFLRGLNLTQMKQWKIETLLGSCSMHYNTCSKCMSKGLWLANDRTQKASSSLWNHRQPCKSAQFNQPNLLFKKSRKSLIWHHSMIFSGKRLNRSFSNSTSSTRRQKSESFKLLHGE